MSAFASLASLRQELEGVQRELQGFVEAPGHDVAEFALEAALYPLWVHLDHERHAECKEHHRPMPAGRQDQRHKSERRPDSGEYMDGEGADAR